MWFDLLCCRVDQFVVCKNCCDCRARIIHYPGPTIHNCFHDCPIMESSSTFILFSSSIKECIFEVIFN